ncbi:hypothetical protein KO566_12740 [Flavobacteriaceae bacterium XHP0103]|uniref:hypothetical protein n=1 Tax=Marixanthotalea marina TaxID=2844359 RepID=UPI002989B9A7|nr:hypothetical protein [Marixanthotalea marina]MBU3822931.1 hypothetical protein [Marixanthotalea marina]
MRSPTPIEDLPSVWGQYENNQQSVRTPDIKYIIIGGAIVLACIIFAAVIADKSKTGNTVRNKEED